MRVLIVSDIHANVPALEAVLADADRRGGYEAVWCLGDTVGYGAQPNEAVERIRQLDAICLAGNHDLGALGKISLADFNQIAAAANRWTGEVLTAENRAFLESLPVDRVVDEWTLAHGTPQDPIWEYLISPETAAEALAIIDTAWGLVGHSHLPLMAERHAQGAGRVSIDLLKPGEPQALADRRIIFNPGSVGQPRDRDPRAAYALLDRAAGTFTLHRVAYDVGLTQELIIEAGLPRALADRLEEGW